MVGPQKLASDICRNTHTYTHLFHCRIFHQETLKELCVLNLVWGWISPSRKVPAQEVVLSKGSGTLRQGLNTLTIFSHLQLRDNNLIISSHNSRTVVL